jgi:uncharacterized protein YqjF (DUF2071 family)
VNGSTRASDHSVIPAQAGIQARDAPLWIPAYAGMTVAGSRSAPVRWRWAQHWRELLFAHWPVSFSALRRHLPAGVEIDTWHGQAWVSAVAFRLNTRLAGWPSIPFVSSFLELNLRTYVRDRDQPAVWFLSMHGSSRPAVWLGRKLTPLPYSHALIRLRRHGQQWQFLCGDALRPLFAADFRPFGETRCATEGTLDFWLTERYAAVVAEKNGNLLRMIVEHLKWEMQPAAARIEAGRLGRQFDLDLNRPPDLVHYSESVDARVSSFEPCWSTQPAVVD